jgi:hypothetical protein
VAAQQALADKKDSSGQNVSLTATPDLNSDFKGWTPASCGTAFQLTANTSCSAQFDAKPIMPVIIDPNPCVRGSELNAACNGAGDKTTVTTIGPNGQLSNTIIDAPVKNEGWVSDSTITPKGKLDGGTATGSINNKGFICNIDFKGGSLKDGTLCGDNKNTSTVGGTFENVTFAPCATLTGGEVKGKIKGDPNCPAKLKNVKVADDSTLSDVELDATSSKGKNVTTTTNPKLSELKKGTAIDSLGNQTTSSDFYGGNSIRIVDSLANQPTVSTTSSNYTAYLSKTSQKLEQPSRLRGRITASAEDVGKTVDFVIYSPFWSHCADVNKIKNPPYFMADGGSKISYWDQKPETLKAFKTGVILETIQDIDMFNGFFITQGCLNIVFGYRLQNGTIVTNSIPNTIDVEVK